jgi:uncharacterized protein (TIGR02611 family)
MSAPADKPSLIDRLREQRGRHVERNVIYRVAFALTGLIVLLAGVAMLVLPGPAFVVIPIGLAMLALEFAWAENMLEKALERAEAAKGAVKKTSRAQRIFGAMAIALGVAAAIAVAVVYDLPGRFF